MTSGHGDSRGSLRVQHMVYLQRCGDSTVDVSVVEVCSRERDDLPGQQWETPSPALPPGEDNE